MQFNAVIIFENSFILNIVFVIEFHQTEQPTASIGWWSPTLQLWRHVRIILS